MKNIKRMNLYVFFAAVIICLFTSAGQAHLVDAFYTSNQNVKALFIEKDTELKNALEIMGERYNIDFLYRSDIVDDKLAAGATDFSGNLENGLEKLLDGTGLRYTNLNSKTYGIYSKDKNIPKSFITETIQNTVNGRVTDAESDEVLPGVSILVKGTDIGTSTDINGRFTLEVPNDAETLVFSYIGYETKEVLIEDNTNFEVTLTQQVIAGEELVVVGYGIVRKSDLTGSVSSISQKSFKDSPSVRPEQVLQGRASGIEVTNQSGAPGGDIRVRIRGINSITGDNDPLYVIDGVAAASQQQFSNLNVSDIASIEVLKDASATAIYGSRGANGVILVTTREGDAGTTQVGFESQVSWGNVTDLPEMLSASDFAIFYNEYRRAQGAGSDFYSQQQISEWEQTGGVNYLKALFETSFAQTYKLNVSGGSESVQYYVSGDVVDASGALVNSKYQRLGFRGNVNADVTDKLSLDIGITGNRRFDFNNLQRGGGGSAIRIASIYAPTIPFFDDDGNWERDNVSSLATNPYGERIQSVNNDDVSYFFRGNVSANFELPIEGLMISVLGGADYRNQQRYTLSSMERNLDSQNSASSLNNTWFNWQITNQLNYTNQWGDHRLDAMIATEFISEEFTSSDFSIFDLLTETVDYWNLSLGSIDGYGNNYTTSTIASYFTRVNYNLMDKYLFTGTLRYDGSSRFQGDNKWGYFPSFSVAWNLNNESFIQDLNIFDELRLRTSWGVSGTQSIPPFSTLGLLGQQNYGYGTSDPIAGFTATNFSSPNLSWERTSQWNLGVDLGFFDYRLMISSNAYYKQTKDLLLNVPLPLHIGGGTVLQNVGQVDNKGIELDISVIPVRSSDMQWESTFNAGYIQNEVVDLGGDGRLFPGGRFGGDNTFNMAVLQKGEAMGSIWGYEWLGIWGTDEADEAARYGQSPGDNKFQDVNDDGAYDSEDHQIIGNAFPEFTFGWNNIVSWNNFDFNLFFQGAIGAERLNVTRQGMSSIVSEARFITSQEGYEDMWTPDNQDTNIPNHFSGTTRSIIESSQWLENADFIRLKNLSLGYTFSPLSGSSTLMTLTAGVENVITITNYSGMDPEVSANTGNPDTNAGIEFGGWPNSRTVTFGFNIVF